MSVTPDPPAQQRVGVTLEVLPETLAICRLAPEAPFPRWALGAAGFVTLTRTADELSVTVAQEVVPQGTRAERNYRALRVRGPLAPELVGVLLAIAEPLAETGVSIFAIATYDTDYVLVKADALAAAVAALRSAGHQVVV